MLHMASIGVRELRQNASVYLARVVQGEVIDVTSRGKVIARLVPAEQSEWQRLVTAGQITEGSGDSLEILEPLDRPEAELSLELSRQRAEEYD